MVNVDCPGCGEEYSVAEKRVPDRGMKMRCPKCGSSFLVQKPGSAAQAPTAPPDATPAAPPRAPRRSRARTQLGHGAPVAGGLGLAPPGTASGSGRNLETTGAPVPPPTKKPIFSPPRPIRAVTDKVDLGLDNLLGSGRSAAGPDTTDIDGGFEPAADPAEGGGFGVLDLALPGGGAATDTGTPDAGGEADLPAVSLDADLPVAAVHGDLPVPAPPQPPPPRMAPRAARPAAPEADLPAVPQHADLPAVAPHADLPAVPQRTDLPAVAQRADLPAVAQRADLPVAVGAAGLPIVAPDDHLPAVAQRTDLPSPVGGADLPLAVGPADLPIVGGHANLPVAPGRADLPLPAGMDDLPVPADQDLPLPTGAGLPVPADQDLPLPSATGDLPLPADFNFPTRIGTSADSDIPMSGDDGNLPVPRGAFGGGAADDLAAPPGGGPPDARADHQFLDGGEFPAQPEAGAQMRIELGSEPPPAMPPRREGGADGVGDEFDLDQVGDHETELLGEGVGTEDGQAPRVKIKRKRSQSLRLALLLIPVLAIAGGLLSLTSLGPYGYYAISDALSRSTYEAALNRFRSSAQAQLASDNAGGARVALEQARKAQGRMPRFAPMASYAAFLAFANEVRFGSNNADHAVGKQLLGRVPVDAHDELWALAQAAQSAADGQLAQAQSQLGRLMASRGGDIDTVALAAEVALAAGANDEAKALWAKARKIQKSARTLYGAARTQLALGKEKEARKTAEEVLALSKNHAGARTLLATVLWHENKKSVEGFALLAVVTKPGAVRDAASKGELVQAYSLIGAINLSQSHLGAAEKAFKAALKIDPQSVLALIGNGELFYVAGRHSEALARFEAAHRIAPERVLATVGMAKTKLALERPKEARAQLAGLLGKSTHPLVGYWLGQAQEALGEKDQAEKAYQQAIKVGSKNPQVVQAYVALANLLDSKGKTAAAANVLSKASETLPESAELHNARGDVALKAGRLDEAATEFTAALQIEKDNTASRFRLAVTQRRAHRFAEATETFKTVAIADPNYPGLALEQGLLFQETGETKRALEMYENALKKAPNDDDLKLRVGSTLVISNAAKQALPLLREVFQKRPRSAEVNHFLGRALLAAGESPQEALTYLQNAVRYDSHRAQYYLYVGWAANEAGQPTVAEAAIAEALKLDRNLGDAYWQHAVVLQKRGQTLDALDDLAIALEKNPSRTEAYATMALCYQDQSNYPAAEKAWLEAIAGNDGVPEWHFRAGKIMMDRGAKADAAAHLRKAVDTVTAEKHTPGWLWNANFLLGEALRATDPKRALQAYKQFLRLSTTENAYRPDAEQAIAQLKGKR